MTVNTLRQKLDPNFDMAGRLQGGAEATPHVLLRR